MDSLKTYAQMMMLVAIDVVAWLPFLYGAYLAIKKGNGVRGRWLYVLVGPILTLALLIVLPLILLSVFAPLAIFVVPTFKQALQYIPWWLPIVDWWTQYWWLSFVPMAIIYIVIGTLVSHALWKRWPRLFDALVSSAPASPAQPHQS